MRLDVWRHLVAWEVRHALRSATFWVMAAVVALVPAWIALSCGPRAVGDGVFVRIGNDVLVFSEVMVVSALVALWTVFSVKRQVAADVSDDWLLVVTYRHSLVSRYLAGAMIGLVLALAAAVGATFAAALLGGGNADVLRAQPLVALSIIQPVALASIIVAAADFLVAPTAVVLFVLLVLDALWCAIPFAGFAWPAAMLTADPSEPTWLAFTFVAIPVCLMALTFGWWKAEDFWAYLKLAHRRERQASLGEVRSAVEGASAPKVTIDRERVSRTRSRLVAGGTDPLIAHDLARYPWWFDGSRLSFESGAMTTVAVAVFAIWASSLTRQQQGNLTLYVIWFAWWLLAAATVLRALTSGASIVVQEKEQRTIDSLLVAPIGIGRLINGKLCVVLQQAAPVLAVMMIATLLFRLPAAMAGGLCLVTLAAAVGGVLASTLSGSRLLATILAGILAAVLSGAAGVLGTAWMDALPPVILQRTPVAMLGYLATGGMVCGLAWLLLRPLAVRMLYRQVAAVR